MIKATHYVPVSYQGRFTNAEGLLCVYDKDNLGQVKYLAPRVVGVENNIYTVELEGKPSDILERTIFSPLDGAVLSLLNRWSEPRTRISSSELPAIAQYVAFQYTRVPRTLELMNELAVKHLVEHVKATASDPQEFEKSWARVKSNTNKDEPGAKEKFRQQMLDVEAHFKVKFRKEIPLAFSLGMTQVITDYIYSMQWSLVDSPRGEQFITCDAPVVAVAPDGESEQFGANFASPQFQITFAISPTVCLLIRKVKGQGRWRCGREFVFKHNRRAAAIAERFIYSQEYLPRVHEWVQQYGYTRQQPKVNRAGFSGVEPVYAVTPFKP